MYSCTEPGCTRAFKRAEHLSRHRLNHRPRKILQCDLCQKDFVRQDLLQRHIRRHERGMTYRNSGGFSNSGTASTTGILSVSGAGTPASAVVSDESGPPMELRGPSPPALDILEPSSPAAAGLAATIAAAEPHGPGAGHRDDDNPQQPASHQNRLILVESANELDHLTFFDGSYDANGLTENLDWLFDSTSPWDLSADSPRLNPPATSPMSELSHDSLALSQLESAYQVPRERILSVLGGLPAEVLASSFFHAVNLESFMQNYWKSYNPHFSLLHRPTFSVPDAPPLLLVALLTLGATLSPEPEHYRVAEQIHQNLRWLIFTSASFQVPAPLWVVQALLVVQSYEKMFSTRKLHEMSHIFHYSVITLMRRGSCYSVDREDDGDISSLEKTWLRWSEREMSYRAAYFAFVMDAQHSSIFGHTAALSITDIHLPLPCADALWEAPTAAMWQRERSRHQSTPLFLPAVRGLLSRHPVPHTYSPFARFVLLHGLFCLTRHMINRDQTASYISDPPASSTGVTELDGSGPSRTPEQDNWKDRLDRAIDTWSFSLLSQSPSLCLEAARPLRRIAHVSIQVPLVDFHILAGAPNLATGVRTPPDNAQFLRSFRRVREWAQNRNAKRALSHCLLLIQETMFTRLRYSAADDSIILRPWALYHVTLVLWAYGIVVRRLPAEQEAERSTKASSSSGQQYYYWSAEEYLAHMLNGLMGDTDIAALPGASRTAGLISTVQSALKNCRWELLEEARETLGHLPTQETVLLSMVQCEQP